MILRHDSFGNLNFVAAPASSVVDCFLNLVFHYKSKIFTYILIIVKFPAQLSHIRASNSQFCFKYTSVLIIVIDS